MANPSSTTTAEFTPFEAPAGSRPFFETMLTQGRIDAMASSGQWTDEHLIDRFHHNAAGREGRPLVVDGAGTLRIEAQQLQDNLDPRLFIKEKLGIENLQQSEPLEQFRLVGHTGLVKTAEGTRERIAVIYLGRRAMIFRGQASSDEVDAEILASIRSFRAIQRGEGAGVEAKIRFVQASEFFDFKIVAQQSRIANYPEETLRLLNNYYPAGKPAPGTWIKLVE